GVVVADDRERESLPAAANAEAVAATRRDLHTGKSLQLAVQFLRDLGLPARAFAPGRQGEEHEAAATAATDRGEQRARLATVQVRLGDRLDLTHLPVGVVDGRTLRGAHRNRDEAAIFLRRQLGRQNAEADDRG